MLSILYKTENYVVAVLLTAMTILVIMQVVFRYFLQISLDWGEELSRYLFIWTALLGAAIGSRRREHFGVDALVKVLPARLQTAIFLFVTLCTSVFMGMIVFQGTKLAIINLSQASPTLSIPMGIPYAAVPLCGLLILVHILADAWTVLSLRSEHRDN